MRVLLTSHGSTGDIYPVIRLGRALVEAGHEVGFATVRLFQSEIESTGVTFVRLPPDWDQSGWAGLIIEQLRHGTFCIQIPISPPPSPRPGKDRG